ncbi:hypothetical protein ABL78_5164 [Leptomonas seymouri]|uniref:Uncharacterized protein n=1 Tax=Leptomonas seymouri TaxID=5684 RepID=A0A0N1I3U7_LEPSE|nr:hypothetical protein ABL78_5164 [Leptomonas seymouri]|eukprot:KPI85773.1 hypothetical protein ABL78_5164 [Leptomonas seymouri]
MHASTTRQKRAQGGLEATATAQKVPGAKRSSQSSPLRSESSGDEFNVEQHEQQGCQSDATSATITTVTSDVSRHGPPERIRVVGYSPAASTSTASQHNVTRESLELRPSWERRLASLRQRREAATAERARQSDPATVASATSESSPPAEDRYGDEVVVRTSTDVERTRQQQPQFAHNAECSASPFSSVLSRRTSDGESVEACHSSLNPPPVSSLVLSCVPSAAVKVEINSASRLGGVGGSDRGTEGSSLPSVPLVPRRVAATALDRSPLASPSPSAMSSISTSRSTAVMGAVPSSAANAERLAMAGSRPTFLRMPSNMSATSSATFAEAPVAERSFGMLSWRESPPSRPICAAPMQVNLNFVDEESQAEVMYGEAEMLQMDWYAGTPPPELSEAAGAGVLGAAAKKHAAAPEATGHALEHAAPLQKWTASPLSTAVSSSSASLVNASLTYVPSEMKGKVVQKPSGIASSPSDALESSYIQESIDDKHASPSPCATPPSTARVETYNRAVKPKCYPEDGGLSRTPGASSKLQLSALQLQHQEAHSSLTSTIASTSATLSWTAYHEGESEEHQERTASKERGSAAQKTPTPTEETVLCTSTAPLSGETASTWKANPTRQQHAAGSFGSAVPQAVASNAHPRDWKDCTHKDKGAAPASTEGAGVAASAVAITLPLSLRTLPSHSQSVATYQRTLHSSHTASESNESSGEAGTGESMPPVSSSFTSTTSSEPPNLRPSQRAAQQRTVRTTVSQALPRERLRSQLIADDPAYDPLQRKDPTAHHQRGVAGGDDLAAYPAYWNRYVEPLQGSKGIAAALQRHVSSAAALKDPLQKDTKAEKTAPSAAPTPKRSLPLTQFRSPFALEGPALEGASAARTAKPDEKGAATSLLATKALLLTSHENASTEHEGRATSTPQQPTHRDPVASNSVASASPRLSQGLPVWRPLMAHLVSNAVLSNAVEVGGSVSITPASPPTNVPSSVPDLHVPVATSLGFTPAAVPSCEAQSPPAKKVESRRSNSFSPSPQPQQRSLEPNQPDWHESLVAGVRQHRGSPHTTRPHCSLRERPHSGRITSVWNSASPGAWDGLMRSTSAKRDALLLADSALASGNDMTSRAQSTASCRTSVRSQLSTALYSSLNATKMGLKYDLTDMDTASPSWGRGKIQIIREELELREHLSKLKAETLRWRRERYY